MMGNPMMSPMMSPMVFQYPWEVNGNWDEQTHAQNDEKTHVRSTLTDLLLIITS